MKVTAGWNWYVLFSKSETRNAAAKLGQYGSWAAVLYLCSRIPNLIGAAACGTIGAAIVLDIAGVVQDAARNGRCFQMEVAYAPVVPIDWYTHTCTEE